MKKEQLIFRVGILTVSDRCYRGESEDLSGPALAERMEEAGYRVTHRGLVPDEQAMIQKQLVEWADSGEMDLILTSGGTGFAPRDITPEATLAVIERATPGLDEMVRVENSHITPMTYLSRAASGIRGKCLIINLPGSKRAVLENIEPLLRVLYHGLALLTKNHTLHET